MLANEVLTWATDGIAITVAFDRWDALQPNRARWYWRIQETTRDQGFPVANGPLLAQGDDLTTVCDDFLDHAGALETLAAFLGAWAESVRTTNPTDNANLFPMSMLEKVDALTWDDIAYNCKLACGKEDM